MRSDFLNGLLSLDRLQRDSGFHLCAEAPPLPRFHPLLRFRGRDFTPYCLVRILGRTSAFVHSERISRQVVRVPLFRFLQPDECPHLQFQR